MRAGDRFIEKKSKREGTINKVFYGMVLAKLDGEEEAAYFLDEIETAALSKGSTNKEENSCGPVMVKVVRCEDCDLWNTWDKQGELCSCAHFTLDDSRPVYTKSDDFCSYAEQR